MTEPLKFFKVDHTTIYQDGFSYSFYRDLDPPKSSADLQLHQSFHCALRSAQEQNCRSRCHVTGNWQMDKKGSKFMLGIVKKADHTHGPEYRDTTPKFKFYKNNDESLHRNGFDYSLYRELDPPKQIADLQWHWTYRCSMSDQENCRARIYTTGQWEVNKRGLEYQLGIFKNCIHNHGSEQNSNGEDNKDEKKIVATASSSNHTKDLGKFIWMPEPLKFFKVDHTTIYQDGFSYSFYRDLDPPKSSADLQLHQSFHCALRSAQEQNCRSRCHVTGNWQMDKKGSKFMLGIVKKADHTHGPEYRDTIPKFRFYKNNDESLHRNGFDYSLYRELDPPKQIADFQWPRTYRCSVSDQENCRARIYTTGYWQKNKRGLEYQLGIFKNCIHNHGSEQDSKKEGNSNENHTMATGSSWTHTKDLDKKEQIRFYKYKQTCLQRNGFVYYFHSEIKSQGNWKHRMFCQ
ncbi:hypothetical protein DdX_13711 [Ditylenchus destructor]|uniref:Uncharacterized protein n=1 Tax=Ditylenchus destructor TaxID=166010 RepID=A0AAD4MVV4_9BILA|nr:hypothetical protein DdX_13711 [Ditylenchus destructor]